MNANAHNKVRPRGAVRHNNKPRLRLPKSLWQSCLGITVVVALAFAWPQVSAAVQGISLGNMTRISVHGDLRYVSEQDVKAAVAPYQDRSVALVSLDQVREALESIAWVDYAVVRRELPDGLDIKVVSQRPIARWGTNKLVNNRGELFDAGESIDEFAAMPLLLGPEDKVIEMMSAFIEITTMIRHTERAIAVLETDKRGSWRMTLDNGVQVALGRDGLAAATQRFLKVYADSHEVRYTKYDARYINGVAVM